MALPRLIRRVAVSLATLVAGVTVAAAVATPAQASAYGCTFAPGYSGALNCIDVVGAGLIVSSSRSEYQPGVTPWPPNICNRSHQWRYMRQDGVTYNRTISPSSCIPGILISYVDWSSPGVMKDNSSFCARSKNSHTNGVWTNYACVTIHA